MNNKTLIWLTNSSSGFKIYYVGSYIYITSPARRPGEMAHSLPKLAIISDSVSSAAS